MTKCHIFFNIISSVVHALPSVVQCLDSNGVEVFVLALKKVIYSENNVIINLILVSSQMFIHVRKQKIIRWCPSSFELFVMSFMQQDVYIGHTVLALMLGLQVFS